MGSSCAELPWAVSGSPFPQRTGRGWGGGGFHSHNVELSFPPPNAERFVYPHQLLHPSLLRAIYKALNSIAPGTQGTKGDNNSRKEPNGFIFSLPPPTSNKLRAGGPSSSPPQPRTYTHHGPPSLGKTLSLTVPPVEQMCPGTPILGPAPLHTPSPQPPHLDLLAGDGVLYPLTGSWCWRLLRAPGGESPPNIGGKKKA